MTDQRLPDLTARLEHALTLQNHFHESVAILQQWLKFSRTQHWDEYHVARDATREFFQRIGEVEQR